MEDKILEILRRTLGVEDIGTDCSQKNCFEWNSLAQLNLSLELEEAFGISLEPEEIGSMTCYSEIVSTIKSKI